MTFKELEIIEPLLTALDHLNIKEPTPIQRQTIPILLKRKDLMGCAKTGTGKTLAFALPILTQLYLRDEKIKYPRTIKALILVPTRELAIQINETFQSLNTYVNLKSTAVFGGVRQGKQVLAIERGIDVLVACPGRLLDLYQQGFIDLNYLDTLVLDEADRMLDMGFIKEIYKILDIIPVHRQTMLFSATISPEIQKLTNRILNEPIFIKVTSTHITVDKINQQLYFVDKENKAKLLFHLLKMKSIEKALIFVRTKRNAETLCKKLLRANITCDCLHGSKSQNARNRALKSFKEDQIRILVATDIAARGIDIDDLKYVINFDVPEQAENYVHRIGRTARAGKSGMAITFCDNYEIKDLKAIEKYIKQKIAVQDNPWYPMAQKDKQQNVRKKKHKRL